MADEKNVRLAGATMLPLSKGTGLAAPVLIVEVLRCKARDNKKKCVRVRFYICYTPIPGTPQDVEETTNTTTHYQLHLALLSKGKF